MPITIVKGEIANALTSIAPDHVLGVTHDIYDEDMQEYQDAINSKSVDGSVLGYPTFSVTDSYAVGDIVFYIRKLYKFTSAHAAGAWNSSHVEDYDIAEAIKTSDAGIYDVTANNNGATFESLSDLLGRSNLSTLIPSESRKGGMSMRFVELVSTYTVEKTEGLTTPPSGTQLTTNPNINSGTYTGSQLAAFAAAAALPTSPGAGNAVTYYMEISGGTYTSWLITFVQSNDNKYVQYRLSSPTWSTDIHDWTSEDPYFIDKIMQEVNEAIDENTPIEIHGDVNNAPDEEDLTSVNVGGTDVLKFKDKSYNPLTYSGMGKKILRKNIVDGVNTLTQEMMSDANTIYVIQYDFTLGEDITVLANCVLEFEGGSIDGGTVTGNNTLVLCGGDCSGFKDIKFAGTFKADVLAINTLATTKVDYLYSLLQSFVGTKFILTDDGSFTDYLDVVDGCTPATLDIDGNGYKLTLHSLGVHGVKTVTLKNITIECQNNVGGDWHYDNFKFGLVTDITSSYLCIENVTFVSGIGGAYLRGFKGVDISHCVEEGSWFYLYDCENISFYHNKVVNSSKGYYQIGTQSENSFIHINYNIFKNITGGGVILSGGLKYNVDITHNILENVGSGGAMDSAINIHPWGFINVAYNKIVANAGSSAMDIDAARNDMFSTDTEVNVVNNKVSSASSAFVSVALVGLYTLNVRNNKFNQCLFFLWDSVNVDLSGNTIEDVTSNTSTDIFQINSKALTATYKTDVKLTGNVIKMSGSGNRMFLCNFSKREVGNFNIFCKNNIGINSILFNATDTQIATMRLYGQALSYEGTIKVLSLYSYPDSSYNYGFDIQHNVWQQFLKNTDPLGRECHGSWAGIVDMYGNPSLTKYYGTTDRRPTRCLKGTAYFDTTLGKTIYAAGTAPKVQFNTVAGTVSKTVDVVLKIGRLLLRHSYTSTYDYQFEYFLKQGNYNILTVDPTFVTVTKDWSTKYLTITSRFIGAIGDNYGYEYQKGSDTGFITACSLVSDGTISWVEEDGAAAGVKRSGSTSNRPTGTDIYVGFMYFDTTLGKPVYAKTISGSTVTWVDSTGATV